MTTPLDTSVETPAPSVAELRALARAAMGVTGEEQAPRLRHAVAQANVGWYPLLALCALVIVDEFQSYGLTVMAPEIASSLGISKTGLAALLVVKTLAITLAVLPMAAYVQHRPRRAAVSIVMAFVWAIFTIGTGFVIALWGLLFVMVVDGASTGSVRAVHQPLLVDSYPTSVRARALSAYASANSLGSILGPVMVGIVTSVLGLTWRSVFVAMGLVCLVVATGATRLRDPGFGRWDDAVLRASVGGDFSAYDVDAERTQLGFFETARRLMVIPTVRRILAAFAVLGMLLVPFTTFLSFFLRERWGLSPGGRALFSAVMPVFSIVTLQLTSKRIEAMFRSDPARIVRLSGAALALGIAGISAAIFSPVFVLMVIGFGIATAMTALVVPTLSMATFSIIPAQARPHMAALQGLFLAAVGGGGGLLLLSGVDRRFGTAGAILSLALPGIVAGLVLRTAATTINDDLDQMIDTVIEDEQMRALARSGQRPPLLACRGINFSYGQVQVLFDVDFSVDDGEMVALLGTNGAGKSTLLRVISGLGLPDRGSVRYRGADITYLDPDRRVKLGITQIPGGKAVFGPLSVIDNLRALGYAHGRDNKIIEAGLEASFDAFPRLAERRNQLASTLSGGEQQMLGLAAAFILRPRLLLIDELSLGLAPKIVGELLDMVRLINRQGAAVVLVEQSVNVALSLVEHAYFMEKGDVRFDGPAPDLLARPDLLRSVFLEGASQGLGAVAKSVVE